MTGGVRLHHPTFRSCTFVVELPAKYPVPYDCPSCLKQHDRKSVHLRLDGEGDVIVSQQVYKALMPVGLAGMKVLNEIASPPPLFLGAVDQPKYETVEQKLDGLNDRFYLPGRNKYQGRDRLLKPFKEVNEAKEEAVDREKTRQLMKKRKLFVPKKKD